MELDYDTKQLIERIRSQADSITVPERFRACDPLITKVRDELKTKKYVDRYGAVRPYQNPYFNVRVSPPSVNRAMLILNAVVKQLNRFGCKIVAVYKNHSKEERGIKLFGEIIEFSIEERFIRSDYKPSRKEKKDRWSYYPKYEYTPSGNLSIKLHFYVSENQSLRKTWSDTHKARLEDCLSSFLISVVKAADALKQQRRIREEEKRLREIRIQNIRRQEELERLEQERRHQLINYADQWDIACRIRDLIDRVKKDAGSRYGNNLPREIIDWEEWATNFANELDPISTVLNQILMGDSNPGQPSLRE